MSQKEKKDNLEAIELLKKVYGEDKGHLDLPSAIIFELKDKERCCITLKAKQVQTKNMQMDSNAFEGWAIAIHSAMSSSKSPEYVGAEVVLDVDQDFENINYEGAGHWGRFLYRVLRFSQQYEWFTLSERLKNETTKFEKFLKSNKFTNNVANGAAGEKSDHNKENVIEAKLSEKYKLRDTIKNTFDVGNNDVFRQLPVGLFKGEVKKKNIIFTGGKSAIDLWTWNEDVFEVIELKALNPMMGIITEIFFYTNYMYDLLVNSEKLFTVNEPVIKGDDRGYSNIWKNKDKYKRVIGIMLADEYHPLIDVDFLNILNANGNVGIKYEKCGYKYELEISGVE